MKEGIVAADGIAAEEITADSLHGPYNIPVQVMDAGNGFSICIPSSPKW